MIFVSHGIWEALFVFKILQWNMGVICPPCQATSESFVLEVKLRSESIYQKSKVFIYIYIYIYIYWYIYRERESIFPVLGLFVY